MVERREWALPQTVVQRFQPNEYVAACWVGTCDKEGFLFRDTNGNNKYDRQEDELISYSVGCSDKIVVKTEGDLPPAYNAKISNNGNVSDVYYVQYTILGGFPAYHSVSYFERDKSQHS